MPREAPRPDYNSDHDHYRYERRRERYSSRDADGSRERIRNRDPDRQRRRKGHRATDSNGEPLPGYGNRESKSPTPHKERRERRHSRGQGSRSRNPNPLSTDALASLDKRNSKQGWRNYDHEYVKKVRKEEEKLERQRIREEKMEKARALEAERESKRQYESDRELEREKVRRAKAAVFEEQQRRSYTDDETDERFRGRYLSEERREHHSAEEGRERRRRRERRGLERDMVYDPPTRKNKSRVVSGPLLEEGGNDPDYEFYDQMPEKRGGAGTELLESEEEERKRKKRKKLWIIGGVIVVLLAIIIPVAVVVSNKDKSSSDDVDSAAQDDSKPSNSNLKNISEDDIPAAAQGTILDPFTWYDTEDFNVTYTNETVGGLPIMGLNSTWDDSVRANDNVPPLNETWEYGTMPIRGMCLGGWLNLEPWITPSFFDQYTTSEGIIDEWTLTKTLGSKAASTLEKHYSEFVTRETFEEIRAAGFDHVRLSFNYWAVTTYDGDPYVPKISWRYLLRGIEWARQNGLRVNLDLHGVPGSQNGWNHSGRQGVIGFLNGTDGDLNAQRTLDIHNQLSQFFAQPRYKNVVTMYGLMNEPRMVDLNTDSVIEWYNKAIPLIQGNNITAIIVFGDGFMGLDNWQGKLQNYTNLVLDVHQYVVFNVDQLVLGHADKVNFACAAWTSQTVRSSNNSTGFGPTLTGEWSQADTDCAHNLNNVGVGTRWEGTYDTGNSSTSVLDPTCPTKDSACECDDANADPSAYSDAYKQFLYQFALAQMESFEKGWGWFYWTWVTESAPQWSWKTGMAAGILPSKAYDRDWKCADGITNFTTAGLSEEY